MSTTPGKFLVAATVLCLSVAFNGVDSNAASAADYPRASVTSPANIGEIKAPAIEIYQRQMRSALSITDPPRRDAAVTSARQQLAQNVRKPLTVATIAELDGLLDIGGISPQLGASG
jgi:hypothetical protein